MIKRRLQKDAFDKLKYIKRKFYLNELANKLFKLYEKNEKRFLYNNILKWKNITKKINLNISQRKKVYEMILKVLTKAFSYKKSFSILGRLLDNYLKKNYTIFLDKFKHIYSAKTNFSIKNEIQNTKISKVFNFKYKNIIKENYNLNKCDNNKEKIDNIKYRERQNKNKIFNVSKKTENKNIIISLDKKRHQFYNERLLPYLIAYLNKLRIKRLKISFEYLYNRYKYNLFCNKFSTWCKSQSLLSKKKLIDNLKHNIFKQKILEYMRKSGIKKLTSYYLVITKRRNDLFILVHLTKVFKRINQLIKAVRFIRLWRLYWKLIRERELQLEKMEKSFSLTYEKISGDIFLDNEEEKSVQTQMMTFVDSVNYGNFHRKKSSLFKSLNSLYDFSPEKSNKDNLSNNIIGKNNKTNNLVFNTFDEFKNDEKDKKNFKSSDYKIKTSIFKEK